MSGEARVVLKRGGLYLGRETCERYFPGLESVILLRRGDDLMILPVRHPAGGGYLLKQRNRAGDRVVHAPDFFREHGLDDQAGFDLAAAWMTKTAGLLAEGAFRLQT